MLAAARMDSLERMAMRRAIEAADDDFLAAIADAELPFWTVVREAVWEVGHVSP